MERLLLCQNKEKKIMDCLFTLMVRSSPTGKFICTIWEVVFMSSGAFKSFFLEEDGNVPSLI